MYITTKMRTILLTLATLLSAQSLVDAQDLQGHCITCKDRFLTCKLGCVMPHYRDNGNNGNDDKAWPIHTPKNLATISECVDECSNARSTCKDSIETLQCYSCTVGCTKSFDDEILTCVRKQSEITKATYNANQDACANAAGHKATSCMKSCYGNDRDILSGWTPETEIGIPPEKRTMDRFTVPEPKLSKKVRSSSVSTSSKLSQIITFYT